MPFDPKLIPGDDAEFDSAAELQLPPDLAAMAEQLGDDAVRLSAAYPPPAPSVIARSPRRSSNLSYWLVRSFAGTALAAGLVTISLVASNSYRPQPNEGLPEAALTPGNSLANTISTSRDRETTVPVTPASWLRETSAPELEGLMDLWEQEKPAKTSLTY